MQSTRKEALSLYRTLLRHAETWEARNPHNTIKERQYILSQASLIRKNKDVSYDEAKELVCLLDCNLFPYALSQLRKADLQIQVAEHYHIPYEKPHMVPTGVRPDQVSTGAAQARINKKYGWHETPEQSLL